MTLSGIIIMVVSVVGVTAFFFRTIYLVFTKKAAPEHLHSILDETPDIDHE